MKLTGFLMLAAAGALLFAGCKKDDADPVTDMTPAADPGVNYLHGIKAAPGAVLQLSGKIKYPQGAMGNWYYSSLVNAADLSPSGTYVLKNDGTVWILSDSASAGQPALVPGFSNITAISAGLAPGLKYLLALKSDGTVWAVGKNNHGQLGDSSTTDRSIPVQVKGLSNVVAVSAGPLGHAIALRIDGSVWGWGYNTAGELGAITPLSTACLKATQIQGFSGISSISAGEAFTLASKNDGTVWACGKNSAGQLGDGTNTDHNAPIQVPGITGVKKVAAGAATVGTPVYKGYALALKSDSTVWAWGYNDYGDVGNATTNPQPIPVKVFFLKGITSINQGCFAIDKDGVVWAWGDNTYGQLGLQVSTAVVDAPQRVIDK